MKITSWATAQWLKLPAWIREHVSSAVHTFVAAFLTQACIDIASNGYVIPFEKAAAISLLASAVRAAWKALVVLFLSWRAKK